MRHIGNLPNSGQAQLFHDYLYAQGIRNEVERESDVSWMVWVIAEEQLETARELLDRFRRDPAAPEFARATASADQLRAREAREETAYRKRFFKRSQVFPGTRPFTTGILTYSLIVACVGVALFSKLGDDLSWLRYLFISDPVNGAAGFLPEVHAGEAWRLLTPVLIHFGPAHLLFNMLWLFQLGSMIEGRQGRVRLALIILALAIGSNVAQYARHGPEFGGMSGVIYGLFGYVWVRGRLDPGSGLYIDRQNVVLMIVWFFACFTGLIGPIANIAHASGLIMGVAYGFVTALLARRHRG